jgi:hypothetical protein
MHLATVLADPVTFNEFSFFQPIHDSGHGAVVEKNYFGKGADGNGPMFVHFPQAEKLGDSHLVIFLYVLGMFGHFLKNLAKSHHNLHAVLFRHGVFLRW